MSDWDFGGAYVRTAGALQNMEQQQQLFPLTMQHEQATTRLNNANAAIAEQRVQADKNMADLMQGMTIADGESNSGITMKMAGVAMKAGDAVTARDLLLRASQMHADEARQAQTAAMTAKYQSDMRIKVADRYHQLLSGVRSQADLDAANFMFQSEFGQPGVVTTYDPNAIGVVQQSLLKAKDRIYADHLAAVEGQADRRISNTQDYRAQLLDIRRAAEARRAAAAQDKTKNAGKDVGSPGKVEIDSARDLLDREGKSQGLDAGSQRTAAFDLASRARALRRQNPGLDAGEAMQRALVDQVNDGYFSVQKATGLNGLLGRTKNVYGRPGGSAEKPAPVPADRSTMKPQTYYSTPKGTLLYLGGGKWQVPKAAAPAIAPAGSAEDDEED